MNEHQITQACESFQAYAITQIIYDWIRTSPNPQAMINALLAGWKVRMNETLDEMYRAEFERTGLVNTGRGTADAAIVEAESRIRASLAAMIADSDEVDSLAQKYGAAQSGVAH